MKMKMETLKSEGTGEGSGEGGSSEYSQSFSSASSTGDLGEKNIRKTWLGRILAVRNIPDQLITLCEAQLVEKEGYGSCETFARSSPGELNRAYLQSLGITGQGILQELLNLHQELHDEWLAEENCSRDFFEGTRNAKDDQSREDGAQTATAASEAQSAQQVNLNTIPATTASTAAPPVATATTAIARSYLSTAAPTCLRDVPQTIICRVVWFGVMVVCILACETMPFPVPLLSIVVLTGMVVRSPNESDTTLPVFVSTIVSPTLITLTTTICKYLLQWTAVRIVLCFVFLCATVDESVPLVLRVGAVCALLGLVLSAPADSVPEADDCVGDCAGAGAGARAGKGNSAVVGSDVGSASASVQQRDDSDQRCSFGHGSDSEVGQSAGGGTGSGGADDKASGEKASTLPGSSTSGTTSLSTTLDATHDTAATTTNTADNNTTDNTTPTSDTTIANPPPTTSTTTTSAPVPEQPDTTVATASPTTSPTTSTAVPETATSDAYTSAAALIVLLAYFCFLVVTVPLMVNVIVGLGALGLQLLMMMIHSISTKGQSGGGSGGACMDTTTPLTDAAVDSVGATTGPTTSTTAA